MKQVGYTGISFPFRFNGKGGVATSTTSIDDFSHIKEGLMQIIGTAVGERVFELEFGSHVHNFVFQNQDDPIEISRLKFYIEEAVKRWDDRVEINDIEVAPSEDEQGVTYVNIDFHVKKYMQNAVVTIKV